MVRNVSKKRLPGKDEIGFGGFWAQTTPLDLAEGGKMNIFRLTELCSIQLTYI